MKKNVSIILPALNDIQSFKIQIQALTNQTIQPKEIIIIDSSSDEKIQKYISDLNNTDIIRYHRAGYASKFDRYFRLILNRLTFLKRFFSIQAVRLYPSEASNLGASIASGDILAFIDMSTIPSHNWLEKSLQLLKGETEIVFGSTTYQSSSFIQRCIHFSTFGAHAHESNPGTLIFKSTFIKNQMYEGVRAGADLEWRSRIKSNCNWELLREPTLKYNSLPNSLFQFFKKMFVYQLHSAVLQIQLNTKDLVTFFLLILITLVISRWNFLVGWESMFYIPHITKISLLIINIFFLQLLILRRFGYRLFNKLPLPTINNFFVVIFLISLFMVSYKWNSTVAGWIESSRFYIPHLTKFFISFLFFSLLLYRGILFPLKRGIRAKQLFPIQFMFIGIVGTLGDLVKIPGYLAGSFFSLFLSLKNKK
jgi:glycosyltransferase involved in cell wall biosynthesis